MSAPPVIDLEFRLKTYMRNKLSDNILWEFTDQLEKWKLYIGDLADAHEAAVNEHTAVLKAANDRIAAERQRMFELSMLVLNVMAFPVMSWIGGAVQYRLAPKFTNATKVTESFGVGGYSIASTLVEDKVSNKVFGDVAKELATIGTNLLKPAIANWTVRAMPRANPDFAKTSQSWTSFKQGLAVQIYSQQVAAQSGVREIVNNIDQSVEFGRALLTSLYKAKPQLKKAGASVVEQEGQTFINRMLDERRKAWAAEWFYFGNDPPRVSQQTKTTVETQLWRFWMLEDQLDVKYEQGMGKDVPATARYVSRSTLFFAPEILTKLVELNFPVMPFIASHYPTTNVTEGATSYKNGEPMKAAIEHLLGWGRTAAPQKGLLNYGTARTLGPVESYTAALYRLNLN
jgi:hypothetical protein